MEKPFHQESVENTQNTSKTLSFFTSVYVKKMRMKRNVEVIKDTNLKQNNLEPVL
jgi:hypothetical protein